MLERKRRALVGPVGGIFLLFALASMPKAARATPPPLPTAYNLSESTQSTTSASPQDGVVLTFTAGASQYLIIETATFAASDTYALHTSPAYTQVQAVVDDVVYSKSNQYSNLGVSGTAGQPFTTWMSFAAHQLVTFTAGSSHTIKIQYSTTNSSYAAQIRNTRIVAIPVSTSQNVEQTPLETAADVNTPNCCTYGTGTTVKTLTFTPPSTEDYLVLASAQIATNPSQNGCDYLSMIRLRQGTTDEIPVDPKEEMRYQPKPVGQVYRSYANMRKHSLTGGTPQTFRIQVDARSVTCSGITRHNTFIKDTRITAIPLSAMASAAVGYAEVEAEASTTSSTLQTRVTGSVTATPSQPYVVLGMSFLKNSARSGSNGRCYQVNGHHDIGGVGAADAGYVCNSTDEYPSFFDMRQVSWPDSLSHSSFVSYDTQAGGIARIKNARVLMLPVGFCSGQPDGTTCSNGSPCTSPDSCEAGLCKAGPPVPCPGMCGGNRALVADVDAPPCADTSQPKGCREYDCTSGVDLGTWTSPPVCGPPYPQCDASCETCGLAFSATGNRIKNLPAAPLTMYRRSAATGNPLLAGLSYTVETLDLSPGGPTGVDTVVHVMDMHTGKKIAGNDDKPGQPNVSFATIPANSQDRDAWIVVRAKFGTPEGTATLAITPSSGPVDSLPITVRPGFRQLIPAGAPSLRSTSHVFTVEELQGLPDSTILVVSGVDEGNGIAFDDDDGIDRMSWLHLDTDCIDPCQVIIGTFGSSAPVTLIWDEDIHLSNPDNDGVGDALEAVLGSLPTASDSDGDGLSDQAEMMGVEPNVKLATWGADPAVGHRDVFIEADWESCPTCRMTEAGAVQFASFYQGGGENDTFLHIDAGFPNTSPATQYLVNDWGGASDIGPPPNPYCTGMTASRKGYFMHGISNGGGGIAKIGSFCWIGDGNSDIGPHELGHAYGLEHWGNGGISGPAACKPHYKSVMNYAWPFGSARPKFSNDTNWPEFVLNPMGVSEAAGLNGRPFAEVSYLMNAPFFLNVRSSDGAIDWNRDGEYTFGGTVPAAVNWGDTGIGCGQSEANATIDLATSVSSPVLAWLPGAERLYLVNRRTSDERPEYRAATDLSSCPGGFTGSCTVWSPATTFPPLVIPGSPDGFQAPAAHWFMDGSTPKLMVVYPDTSLHLKEQRLAVSGVVDAWTASEDLFPGVPTPTQKDPALIGSADGATLWLYAESAGVLKRWDFTAAFGWSGPFDVRWSNDDLPIQIAAGIGLSWGFQVELGSGPQLFAAIPDGTSPTGRIQLARRLPDGRFFRNDDTAFVWPQGQPRTFRQPGLAFVPYDKTADPTFGRLYLSFVPGNTMPPGDSVAAPRITMTEGTFGPTSGAATRRLRFDRYIPLTTDVNTSPLGAGISLIFDAARDSNLRAAWVKNTVDVFNKLYFFPLADGIINSNLKDYDDYAELRANFSPCVRKGREPVVPCGLPN